MDIDVKAVSEHLSARLTAEALGEIIEGALSDRVSFSQIQAVFGLRSHEVKRVMRTHLRRGGYIAWRAWLWATPIRCSSFGSCVSRPLIGHSFHHMYLRASSA
jgi:uncharacterized protein (TIGR03643 family)